MRLLLITPLYKNGFKIEEAMQIAFMVGRSLPDVDSILPVTVHNDRDIERNIQKLSSGDKVMLVVKNEEGSFDFHEFLIKDGDPDVPQEGEVFN